MKTRILRWSLIIILIIISPLVYTEAVGYMATHAAFPVIRALSVKSRIAASIIFITCDLICAIFTSIISVLPSGYLASKQPRIIAALLVAAIQVFPICSFLQSPNLGTLAVEVFWGQFIAVVVSALAFAEIGSRIAEKRQEKAAV